MSALCIRDLSVAYGAVPVLHGVSLEVARGECLGIVGESGCGKSTLAFAAMRYLPPGGAITAGSVAIDGQDVTRRTARAMRPVWARTVSMVYQDPSRALNPTLTIGAQLGEAYRILGARRREALEKSADGLGRVGIPSPSRVMSAYPHELSGGMQQRVVIAMALAKDPALLVLDEPTTGLDATVEAGILHTIDALRRESGTAVLLISHNLSVIARMAERTGVLYAGVLVEQGPTEAVLRQPRHPYTARLLRCRPGLGGARLRGRLPTIPGQLPPPGALPAGCVFAPRCARAEPICAVEEPALRGAEGHQGLCHFDPPFAEADADGAAESPVAVGGIVLHADGLAKTYRGRGEAVRALAPVSFDLAAGETLAVVGESGSGKTTLARLLLGLAEPDLGGSISLDGAALAGRLRGRRAAERKAMQIVFQHPDSALNRAQTVWTILSRPLSRLAGVRGTALAGRLRNLADSVRLAPAQLAQRPRALSGGLKQRVAIARAFAGDPRIVVCDEPTSALDVSVQAAILNLLADLQRKQGTAYVFISHDLDVVRTMADRIAVLYRGTLVEIGPAALVFAGPNHPYTAALLAASPVASVGAVETGCVFQRGCPRFLGAVCETEVPVLAGKEHLIRCHIPAAELERKVGGDVP